MLRTAPSRTVGLPALGGLISDHLPTYVHACITSFFFVCANLAIMLTASGIFVDLEYRHTGTA